MTVRWHVRFVVESRNMRCLRIGLIVMLGAFVVSLTVRPVEAGAEAAPLTVAYGNGVHAYNDGD